MTRVLFLCTTNSARSQMAEGFLRSLGDGQFEVHSAGSDPQGLHPLTRLVMSEAGIDVMWQQAKRLDHYVDEPWDYVITVCDRMAERCPAFLGHARQLHWSIPDPVAVPGLAARLAAFRAARDSIRRHVEGFVASLNEAVLAGA